MPAFIFANIQSVSNPARFAEYQGLAEPTVVHYAGKFLGEGAEIEIADGDWSPVAVMAAKFESLAEPRSGTTRPSIRQSSPGDWSLQWAA